MAIGAKPLAILLDHALNDGALLGVARIPVIQALRLAVLHSGVRPWHLYAEVPWPRERLPRLRRKIAGLSRPRERGDHQGGSECSSAEARDLSGDLSPHLLVGKEPIEARAHQHQGTLQVCKNHLLLLLVDGVHGQQEGSGLRRLPGYERQLRLRLQMFLLGGLVSVLRLFPVPGLFQRGGGCFVVLGPDIRNGHGSWARLVRGVLHQIGCARVAQMDITGGRVRGAGR
mmetsp:Transcript_79017/g.235485  ORF Transcript_79017/g.235485 Transcript_79017/m.235485 type:complete len:229 (-) Transcript_79017:1035-1721(-)